VKPFVRVTAIVFAILFLLGAGVGWFDVLSHENILTNPELKTASGWLTTGLMLLALGMRGWRRRADSNSRKEPARPPV
jgi:hypothetical protein